jgi:hypothetical protein
MNDGSGTRDYSDVMAATVVTITTGKGKFVPALKYNGMKMYPLLR